MNVAFLYPEVYDMARFKEERREFPPFGVLYLAAIVENAGHMVSILKVVPDNTSLDLHAFDAIGFSLASSATYGHMLEARKNSLIRSDALIMVGGVHCNFYSDSTMREFGADVVATGESEELILDVINRGPHRMFDGIPGILWRDGTTFKAGSDRRLIRDIDQLPLPARHLLPVNDIVMSDRLAGTNTRMAHVMFSRGCPFSCNFCAAAQTKIQYRSGLSARLELMHLKEQYGVDGFAVVDDNFIVNKSKVANICSQIGDLGLRWSALSRVDMVDSELLRQLARSGCIEIKYGVESGSERLLRSMNKNTTREQIKTAVRATVRQGIQAKAFLIHGFPGENYQSTKETMSLLQELGSDISRVSLFRFVPLPGSEVYEHASKYGIHGTHHQPDWDGDWARFHIHHNSRHWWGSDDEWAETEASYQMLRKFIEERWNPQ